MTNSNTRPTQPGSNAESVDWLESVRLWPQPELAPEVPPEEILEDYLRNPGHVSSDLCSQIRTSPNCLRALEALHLRSGAHPLSSIAAHPVVSDPVVRQFLGTLNAPPALKASSVVAPAESGPASRGFGQLWSTCSEVAFWDGCALRSRRTFQPQDVVIVSSPAELPWDDTLCRAVAASPAELWPARMRADDEILVRLADGAAYVLHLWLNYPLSGSQLHRCLGVLDDASAENLALGLLAVEEGLPLTQQEGAGLPLDSSRDSETFLERDRLHARAGWLCATADAWREYFESLEMVKAETGRTILRFAQQECQLAEAAASGERSRGIVLRRTIPELGDVAAALSSSSAEILGAFEATAHDVIRLDPAGRSVPELQWSLKSVSGMQPADGQRFLLLTLTDGAVVGEGRITIAGETAVATLENVFRANFKRRIEQGGELILIVPGGAGD